MKKPQKKSLLSTPKAGVKSAHDLLWYKDAVIYQLHIKSFFDSNNDGVGDFTGLISKLDYIAGLGVTAIWLLPFYPSPRRDDGYDIAEYKGVHSDYGNMADVRSFVQEAHRRNLRVITELVINHTSDQHPWFQKARLAKPGSAARNFYVWSDSNTAYAGTRIIFLDTEKSNWTWDSVANAYFWHRFYSHQPDLNFDNPVVLKEVMRIMKFWLDMGIDGLRFDAVPYLIEREGTSNENLPETHVILKKIRAEMDRSYPNRMFLAEANMWPEDVQQYFGDGDECHMAFHFPLMPRMYMAIAQQDRFPLTDILRQTPDIPPNCQWGIFLRNHDELTLEMVTSKERDYLWNFYAADRRARINMGIRRRLAPLLQRDRRRIELLNSFLLSMPGTPVLYYGDEIGMGDNIHLGDRDGVRTPMQWTSDRNGGFSRADPALLVLPPIMDPVYGFQAINVEAQDVDPHSLLNWTRRMLQVRGTHPVFGRGGLRLLYPTNRAIFAYLREFKNEGKSISTAEVDNSSGIVPSVKETILCVANVSATAQAVELDLSEFKGLVPVEMLGGVSFPPVGSVPYLLTLAPYGFYWFVLANNSAMPSWYSAAAQPLPEYATLVLRQSLEELLEGRSRQILEQESLPGYILTRHWYAEKKYGLPELKIASAIRLSKKGELPTRALVLAEFVATTAKGVATRYQLPVGFIDEDEPAGSLPQQLAIARVRRNQKIGFITDAFSLDYFALQIIKMMQVNNIITTALDGEVHFEGMPSLGSITLSENPEIRRIFSNQTNSSLVIGELIVLKVLRKLSEGWHPEAEMGLFLSIHGFESVPGYLGEVYRKTPTGERYTLMLLQRFIHNQGDGWNWIQKRLKQLLQPISTPSLLSMDLDPMLEIERFAHSLGKCLGLMHSALAKPGTTPEFNPELAQPSTLQQWIKNTATLVSDAFQILHSLDNIEKNGMLDFDYFDTNNLNLTIEKMALRVEGALMIRIHGDLHLGQILVCASDVVMVDFGGESAKSLQERRAKSSPWRDVAGLLNSLDYAAAYAVKTQCFSDSHTGLGNSNVGTNIEGPFLSQAYSVRIAAFSNPAKTAFLQAYRDHMPDAADAGSHALLPLFQLQKAAYEVCHEAAKRPEWLGVAAGVLLQQLQNFGAGIAGKS